MLYLLQNVEFTGPLGYLVAAAIILGIFVAALKSIQWMWKVFGRPGVERFNRVRVAQCEREILEFWKGFFDHRKRYLILILNDRKECIYISTGLALAWQTSFSQMEGHKWRRLHKESTLRRYTDTLDEAYEDQAPFVHPVTIEPDGHEEQFIARGDPRISRKKTMYYVVEILRNENISVMTDKKQLGA